MKEEHTYDVTNEIINSMGKTCLKKDADIMEENCLEEKSDIMEETCLKEKADSKEETCLKEEADIIDETYMKEAVKQAKKAYAIEESPIGCVIVYENKIIARAYNKRNKNKSTLAHAELLAIQKASKVLGDWRLEGCTMYVTLEPCQMCAGAIVQARIPRVVIGTMNQKAGCAGSIINLLQMKEFNHQVEVKTGVLQEECTELMQKFFRELREKKKRKC